MAGTQIQFRRGTGAQNDAFTGALGEVTVDTTNKSLRVHDGSTVGGSNIASVAYVSAQLAALSANKISNTGSNVTVDTSYVNVAINGSNIAAFSSQSLSLTGFLNVTGNVLGATASFGSLNSTGLINTTGNILSTGLSVFGNTRIGSLATPGALHTIIGNVDVSGAGTEYFNIAGNIMAIQGSFDNISVRAAVTAIANGGTSGVGNIGATGATFNTVFAKATTAQYADLAEIYTSDQQYPGGTVVVFGGEAEVTQSHSPHDTRIAGVVSTQPAYLMNHDAVGVPVALQGRVPCRVLGPISKGDRVVSSHIAGVAQVLDPAQYQPGCIIGKALQAIDSAEISVIEVVVGRV